MMHGATVWVTLVLILKILMFRKKQRSEMAHNFSKLLSSNFMEKSKIFRNKRRHPRWQ